MSVSGAQDFWVVGSRLYFQQDAVDSVDQPWVDLGVIQTANPSLEVEKVELMDSDGGLKSLVDEAVTAMNETYEIVCSNISARNLAFLMMAEPPTSFTQSAAEKEVTHDCPKVGGLVKLHDSDTDNTLLFNMPVITGVMSAAVSGGVLTESAITDIVASTKTITATGDLSSDLSPGDQFIVRRTGLANILNAKTYTVVTATYTSSTAIVVVETPAADETTITGTIVYAASGDSGTIYDQDTDWEVVSLDRGFIRIIDGGAISADGTDVVVIFQLNALSGERTFLPQTMEDVIKGEALIMWSRDNHADQTVRQARVSITPAGAALSADDFSNITFTVKVLNDITDADEPAGRVLHFKGTVPDVS